jgi:hypothetical protein
MRRFSDLDRCPLTAKGRELLWVIYDAIIELDAREIDQNNPEEPPSADQGDPKRSRASRFSSTR